MPLPVPTPVAALRMAQRCHAGQFVQRPVVPAPVVLTPRHLAGIEAEIWASDVVMLADLGPA